MRLGLHAEVGLDELFLGNLNGTGRAQGPSKAPPNSSTHRAGGGGSGDGHGHGDGDGAGAEERRGPFTKEEGGVGKWLDDGDGLMSVRDEGGSSGRLTTMVDGNVEWSATGRMGVSLAEFRLVLGEYTPTTSYDFLRLPIAPSVSCSCVDASHTLRDTNFRRLLPPPAFSQRLQPV